MFEHSASPEIDVDTLPERVVGQAFLPAPAVGDTRRPAEKNLRARPLAPWQLISGITPENELTMPPRERRIALRKLFARVDELLREELFSARSTDPAPTSPENPPQESDAHSPSTHGRDARATHDDITFLWDPMRSICRQLGIAHSKLSSLSKEFSGMAAHEIADKMKAAGLREKLRAPLIEFAANLWGYPGHVHFAHIDNYVDEELKLEACDDFSEDHPLRKENDKRSYDQRRDDRIALEKLAKKRDGLLINIDRSPYPGRCCKEEIRWELFRALKRSRREPDFDRNTWAMSLGFANFARMRRACLLEYGKTPAQLEMEILIDLADFYDVAGNLKLRICSSRHRVEARGLRAEKPFIDRWSCARELRFDWLKKMVAELGVSANLSDD